MKSLRFVLPIVVLLNASLFVGCSSSNTPPTEPVVSTPPDALVPTERLSFDPGIKKDDGKPSAATGLAISADGKLALIMATCKRGNVQVWDLENQKKLYQYDNPIGSVLPVAISPDKAMGAYVTQSQPGIVLVDLNTGKELRQLRKKGDVWLSYFTEGLSFSPKGDLVVIASDDEIIGWNPNTGKERFVWKESAGVSALSTFFDGGNKIVAGTKKGSINIWDVNSEKVTQKLVEGKGGDRDEISHLFVSSDGKHLGVSGFLGPITMWDLTTAKNVGECKGSPGMYSSFHFLPDNRTFLYNGDWDLAIQDRVSGETKKFAKTREYRHYPIAIKADGSMFITGSDDGKIRIYDLKPGS